MMVRLLIIFLLYSSLYCVAQQPHFIWVRPDSIIDKKYLIGKYEPETDSNFVVVDSIYAVRSLFYLQKEVYTAFLVMYEAALKDSIELKIISATRNFEYQKTIWEEKWTGKSLVNGQNAKKIVNELARAKTILQYVAMPHTSRHH